MKLYFYIFFSACLACQALACLEEVVSQVKALGCLVRDGFYDRSLGYVSSEMSTYCNILTPLTMRQVLGVTCCSPQSPEEMKPVLRLHRPGQDTVELDWRNKTQSVLLGPEMVVYVMHGWMETVDNSKWVSDAVNAYLASGYQVVAVDWRYGSSLQYFQAASNVRVLGTVVGYSIIKWNILSRTLVTGFSLGGQAVGETARYVKRKGFKLPHCIGLDPAGPAFDGGFPNIRLSRSDCDLVQVIHTSAADLPVPINVLLTELGTMYKSGHCDYWINCGHHQPDCKDFPFIHILSEVNRMAKQTGATSVGDIDENLIDILGCSHNRAPRILISSLSNACDYAATRCVGCGFGYKGDSCLGNGTGKRFPAFDSCQSTMDDNFIIRTQDTAPYCGANGFSQ